MKYKVPHPVPVSTLIERQYANDLEQNGPNFGATRDSDSTMGIVSFGAAANYNIATFDYATTENTAQGYRIKMAPSALLRQIRSSKPRLFWTYRISKKKFVLLETAEGGEILRFAPAEQVLVDIIEVDE